VLQPTSTVSSAEATGKRALALEAVDDAGYEALVATGPGTVRWLLCGRGRPVSTSSTEADYTIVLTEDEAIVLFPDIEASRVEADERFEEIGFRAMPFPWHQGHAHVLAEVVDGRPSVPDGELELRLAPFRRQLTPEELDRYRAAGKDVATAVVETIHVLESDATEVEVAADLAARLRRRGFFSARDPRRGRGTAASAPPSAPN